MHTISFTTDAFPTNPEGDLEFCNGQPGSALVAWLRTILTQADIASGEPIQEDYGWGIWLESPATVWVAVSLAGGDLEIPNDLPEWHISISHEIPFFAPRQWFRRRIGRELCERAFKVIEKGITQRFPQRCG